MPFSKWTVPFSAPLCRLYRLFSNANWRDGPPPSAFTTAGFNHGEPAPFSQSAQRGSGPTAAHSLRRAATPVLFGGGQKGIKHTQWVSVFQRYKQPPLPSSFSMTSSSTAERHCTSGAARASYPRCSRRIWLAWMCVRRPEKTKRTAVKGSAEPLFDLKFQLSHRLKIIQVQGNPTPLVTPSEFQIWRLQKFFSQPGFTVFLHFYQYVWRNPVTFLLQRLIDVHTKVQCRAARVQLASSGQVKRLKCAVFTFCKYIYLY